MSATSGISETPSVLRRLLVWLGLTVGLLVVVWLGVAIGVRVAYADRVLPGTTMAGLSFGGQSPDAARRTLVSAFASERSVTLVGSGPRFVVNASELGYRVDVSASVARARDAGRSGPAFGLISTVTAMLSPRALEPIARIDRGRLDTRIAAIAQTIDRPARPGAVFVEAGAPGGVRVLAPRVRRVLERPAARAALIAALHDRRGGPVELPIRRGAAAAPGAVQAVGRRAREYLRTALVLTVGSRTLALTTRQVAGILTLQRDPDAAAKALRLGVDRLAVERLVAQLARALDRAPVDARIRAPALPRAIVEGQGDVRSRPRRADLSVIAGSSGRRIGLEAGVAALTEAVWLGRHGVTLAFTRARARLTTAAARKVTSLLATFTTRYPCCEPRVTNIRLIAREIDGTVVLPAERFSLNEASGERTRAEGYVKAPFISDGKIVPSVGGGVSQFSTTLYNAAYFAGLRLNTHRPHSFYIARYPAGREATLNFPDIDLQWTNDTDSPVLIRAATDATSLTVSLYGTNNGRRVRSSTGPRTPLAGRDFAITVTRVLRYRDGRVAREPFTTRYDNPPPPD